MPDPTVPQHGAGDRITANIAALRQQGASDADVEAYLTQHEGLTPVAPSSTPVKSSAPAPTSHNGVPFVNAKPDEGPGIGTKALGVLAILNRDIPGAEAAQSGVRALLRGEPYAQAREDIRGAEDAAPTSATLPARLIGGGLSMAALPGGAVAKGVTYGGLSGLGDSDLSISKEQRATEGVGGAVLGGLAGYGGLKVARMAGSVARPLARAGVAAGSKLAEAMTPLGSFGSDATLPAEVLRSGGSVVGAIRPKAAPITAADLEALGVHGGVENTPVMQSIPAKQSVLDAIAQRKVPHASQARFDYVKELMAQRAQPDALPAAQIVGRQFVYPPR